MAQKFGFGGKELSEELGLQWHDFSARNYDASLGRWFVIDPLADALDLISSSPYSFALNNPITFRDPDGDCPPGVDCTRIFIAVKLGYDSFRKSFSKKIDNANRISSGMVNTYNRMDKTLGGSGISSYRKATIYASRYLKEFGDFSSVNDVSVLKDGKNLSGSVATTADYGFAAAAVLLPVSGSKVKQAFKAIKDKTTTILGRLADTGEAAKQLDNVKSGMNEGGFNILKQPDTYWSIDTNMKWLQRAVDRGDAIKAASDPRDLKNIFINGVDGKKTVFGLEVDYLKKQGYEYNSKNNSFEFY